MKIADELHDVPPVERQPLWLQATAVLFLVTLGARGVNGVDLPSFWLQLGSVLLFWQSSLRHSLPLRQLVAAMLVLTAWPTLMAWRLGESASVAGDVIEGVLLALGLMALVSWRGRQLAGVLALSAALVAAVVLSRFTPDYVMQTLMSPLQRAGEGGLRSETNRNVLAVAMASISLMSLVPALTLSGLRRLLARGLLLLSAVLLVANGGMGSLAGLAAALICFMWVLRGPWFWTGALVSAVLLCAGLALLYQLHPDYFDVERVASYRDLIVRDTLPHVVSHFWLGAGESYFWGSVAPTMLPPDYPVPMAIPHPHNVYLDYALSFGVPGLLLFPVIGFWLSRRWLEQCSRWGLAWLMATSMFFAVYGLVDLRALMIQVVAMFLLSGVLLQLIWQRLLSWRQQTLESTAA